MRTAYSSLLAALLFTAGCSSAAYADRMAAAPGAMAPRTALAIAPERVRAPYDVQILSASGETLPTYAHRGRFYVQGDAGDRYIIRVSNPTPNRIEAVVTVDGLDVVDGENGDLRKRGYVVQPYGETRIEGFRTSQAGVATFRFSSVSDSYAGRKGKARNVGVIAVALFEEQAPPPEQQVIIGGGYGGYGYGGYGPRDYPHGHRHQDASRAPAAEPKAGRAAPPRARAEDKASAEPAAEGAPSAAAPSSRAPGAYDIDTGADYGRTARAHEVPRQRPGLGTEFGEHRHSAATFTRFVRATNRPIAIAELRYNDAAGLIALGIPVAPVPDENELMTRETADPFPGDHYRFAQPPR